MALARVVTFDGVSSDRIAEMQNQIGQEDPPEGLAASEVIVLHDPEAESALVVVFFENEDDYQKGDEVLSNMPTGDTPGRRSSVKRYDVGVRRTM
jgi:hypothetical protein